jgi:adenine/guanine phosphoribosyltransferase-like PRPP-binding protein/ubiquinone/menaquinone biosynthesis C-methylase UbiE
MNHASYQKIAAQWAAHRRQTEVWRPVKQFCKLLPSNALVLDLGCGSGLPNAKFMLEQGFQVIGIDAVEDLIKIARQEVPGAQFQVGEIETYVTDTLFDGILAWDSLFHLSPSAQEAVLPRLYALLKPGGYLLYTAGKVEGEITGEMFGESFYYGSIGMERLKGLLEGIGFKPIHLEEDYRESEQERDLVVLAKKPQTQHQITLGAFSRDVALIPVSKGISIAYLDFLCDRELVEASALALAEALQGQDIEVIVAPAAGAIPLCYALATALQLPYVILRKDERKHSGQAHAVEVKSIAALQAERLILSEKYLDQLRGKKILLLDTVYSSGSTMQAMTELLQNLGLEIKGKAVVFFEGEGECRDRDVLCLGVLPVFVDEE